MGIYLPQSIFRRQSDVGALFKKKSWYLSIRKKAAPDLIHARAELIEPIPVIHTMPISWNIATADDRRFSSWL